MRERKEIEGEKKNERGGLGASEVKTKKEKGDDVSCDLHYRTMQGTRQWVE